MSNSPNHADGVLRRAHLPEVLFAEDLQQVLKNVTPEGIEYGLRAGQFGPHFYVAGVPAVLRADLFETLRGRSAQQAESAREVLPEFRGSGR